MGRKVNVVLPSGRVVAVDEDVAKAGQLNTDGAATVLAARETARLNEERSSGFVEGAKAAGEGAADALSLGLYGATRGAIDPEGARNMRIRAEERGGSRFVGEAAALLVPGLGEAGALGKTGGTIAKFTAPGAARTAGKVFGGVGGQAVEGAVLGFGGYVSSTNITGDPLTIESAVESATIGGLIDAGFHAAANRFEGFGWAGKLKDAKNRELRATLQTADKGRKVFTDTPPSWNEFIELHEARKSAVSAHNKAVAKEAAEYDGFWQNNAKLTKAIDETDDLLSHVQHDVYKAKGGPFAGDPTKVKYNLDSTGATRTIDYVYDQGNVQLARAPKPKAEVAEAKPASFAEAVQQAAQKAQAFGERKAFISSVYENMPENLRGKSLAAFKKKLLKAHKNGEVVLHRADLVGAMDPKLVAASELKGDGAEFHFIERTPKAEAAEAAGAEAGSGFFVKKLGFEVDQRPEISDATLEKIKEYKARISQLYQKKAGGWKMDKGKWIRDPSVPPDPRGAMEGLRVIQDELKQWRSKASGMMKTQLPPPPRAPMPDIPGELPKSIEEFARKHADQVAEVANSLNDPQMATALERVMKDLDLIDPNAPPKTPTQHLSDLHGTLREYRSKIGEMNKLAEAAKAKEDADAAKSPVLHWIKKAIRYTAGRAVDTGGAWGAIRRQIGGSAAARGMTAVEHAMLSSADNELGAALMSSRLTTRERLRNLVIEHSASAGALGRKLASPLSYLATSFPSGERDTETDPRKQAINRIHELQAAAMAAPDAAFMAVQGMLGQPGDIAWKMHQHVVGTLNYLVSTLPRDPGTDTKLFASNWTPQYHEVVAMAHRLEAINDPLSAIARAIAGNSHPAATEALWAVYPAMMNELAQELSIAAPNLKNLTYEQASAYSNLFRTPLTGLQQPVVVTTIQGLYMRGSQATAPLPAGPAGGATKKAPGRPAAVQSPVAGSNVAQLTQ